MAACAAPLRHEVVEPVGPERLIIGVQSFYQLLLCGGPRWRAIVCAERTHFPEGCECNTREGTESPEHGAFSDARVRCLHTFIRFSSHEMGGTWRVARLVLLGLVPLLGGAAAAALVPSAPGTLRRRAAPGSVQMASDARPISALLDVALTACQDMTELIEAVYKQLNTKEPGASVLKEDKSFFSLADGVVQVSVSAAGSLGLGRRAPND